MFSRLISYLILTTFITVSVIPPQYSYAQNVAGLPVPGTMIAATPAYAPVQMKGLMIDPANPLAFEFIVDAGDTASNDPERGISGASGFPQDPEFRAEVDKLIKYFLASLTVPEDQVWVNLSPYEKDRIVAESLGQTEMGRELLAQDYMLKQLTSSLMYPEDGLGKQFWEKVYERLYAMPVGAQRAVPLQNDGDDMQDAIQTFNKIWIVPNEAQVYEKGGTAYIVNRSLKVMLEEDYVALAQNRDLSQFGLDSRDDVIHQSSFDVETGLKPVSTKETENGDIQQIIRDILIPEIEREVNEGRTFAKLRQIYDAMILASWYKIRAKESLLGQIYVDQNKTDGVTQEDFSTNERIWAQYVESFQKGVFDLIQEDYDPATQSVVPRKYFSGGVAFRHPDKGMLSSIVMKSLVVSGLVLSTFFNHLSADVGDASKYVMVKTQMETTFDAPQIDTIPMPMVERDELSQEYALNTDVGRIRYGRILNLLRSGGSDNEDKAREMLKKDLGIPERIYLQLSEGSDSSIEFQISPMSINFYKSEIRFIIKDQGNTILSGSTVLPDAKTVQRVARLFKKILDHYQEQDKFLGYYYGVMNIWIDKNNRTRNENIDMENSIFILVTEFPTNTPIFFSDLGGDEFVQSLGVISSPNSLGITSSLAASFPYKSADISVNVEYDGQDFYIDNTENKLESFDFNSTASPNDFWVTFNEEQRIKERHQAEFFKPEPEKVKEVGQLLDRLLEENPEYENFQSGYLPSTGEFGFILTKKGRRYLSTKDKFYFGLPDSIQEVTTFHPNVYRDMGSWSIQWGFNPEAIDFDLMISHFHLSGKTPNIKPLDDFLGREDLESFVYYSLSRSEHADFMTVLKNRYGNERDPMVKFEEELDSWADYVDMEKSDMILIMGAIGRLSFENALFFIKDKLYKGNQNPVFADGKSLLFSDIEDRYNNLDKDNFFVVTHNNAMLSASQRKALNAFLVVLLAFFSQKGAFAVTPKIVLPVKGVVSIDTLPDGTDPMVPQHLVLDESEIAALQGDTTLSFAEKNSILNKLGGIVLGSHLGNVDSISLETTPEGSALFPDSTIHMSISVNGVTFKITHDLNPRNIPLRTGKHNLSSYGHVRALVFILHEAFGRNYKLSDVEGMWFTADRVFVLFIQNGKRHLFFSHDGEESFPFGLMLTYKVRERRYTAYFAKERRWISLKIEGDAIKFGSYDDVTKENGLIDDNAKQKGLPWERSDQAMMSPSFISQVVRAAVLFVISFLGLPKQAPAVAPEIVLPAEAVVEDNHLNQPIIVPHLPVLDGEAVPIDTLPPPGKYAALAGSIPSLENIRKNPSLGLTTGVDAVQLDSARTLFIRGYKHRGSEYDAIYQFLDSDEKFTLDDYKAIPILLSDPDVQSRLKEDWKEVHRIWTHLALHPDADIGVELDAEALRWDIADFEYLRNLSAILQWLGYENYWEMAQDVVLTQVSPQVYAVLAANFSADQLFALEDTDLRDIFDEKFGLFGSEIEIINQKIKNGSKDVTPEVVGFLNSLTAVLHTTGDVSQANLDQINDAFVNLPEAQQNVSRDALQAFWNLLQASRNRSAYMAEKISQMQSRNIFIAVGTALRIELLKMYENKGSVVKEKEGDDAMMLTSVDAQPMTAVTPDKVGGINLSSKLLDLQIKRDDKGIPLPFELQDLDKLRDIKGFLPIIIDIKPIFNLPQLLGLNTDGRTDLPQENLSLYGLEKAVRES